MPGIGVWKSIRIKMSTADGKNRKTASHLESKYSDYLREIIAIQARLPRSGKIVFLRMFQSK